MKTEELTQIIENKLFNTVKNIILSEQTENNELTKIQKLETLTNFGDNVSVVKSLDNENVSGYYVEINNVSKKDFMRMCDASTLEVAERNLMKKLYDDILVNGLGENFDIDVNIEYDNQNFNVKIKIISDEKLGDDMETKNSKIVKEQKEMCSECGEMDEKEFNEQEFLDIDNEQNNEEDEDCSCKDYKEFKNKEHGYIHENKKRKLRLTENQLIQLVEKIITESVPGISVTERSQSESNKINKENLKNVDKKLKEYLSFDGNDNPVFPKQIGSGEKMARKNTEKEDEYVENYRGGGMEDLKYDEEPPKEFIEKLKKYIDPEVNEQGHAIKTDTGKNMLKKMETKKEKLKKDPMYVKDPQPVQNVKTKKELQEEIQKMKNMYSYNKKTQ